MAVDYQSLAVKGVQALSPYQPGKPIDELARELGLEPSDIIKLASNENPLGPSEKALAAAALPCPTFASTRTETVMSSSGPYRSATVSAWTRSLWAMAPTMSWK